MRTTGPLFRFDGGWLFVIAGLGLILSAATIPSEQKLHELRTQLEGLRHTERNNFAVMGSYARFVSDFDDHDPSLIRRLAASQLNVIPRDETPLLMASSVNASVSDWIEATAELDSFEVPPPRDSLLSRWIEGRGRLWAIGAGGFLVFAGLLVGPGALKRRADSIDECERGRVADAPLDAEDSNPAPSSSFTGACEEATHATM